MAWSLIINGFIGMIAGVIIGLERQWKKKLAGIRTTALVCYGSSLFVTLSTLFANDGSPTRIAAQVVSGIGFLAGGVIIRDGFSVSGINTAATIWGSAAIGAIIGAGFHWEGLLCALMLMFINIFVSALSNRLDNLHFFSDKNLKHHYLSISCPESEEINVRTTILETMNHLKLDFNKIVCGEADETGKVAILLDLEIPERAMHIEYRIKTLMEWLLLEKNIYEVQRLGSDLD
ncbi:MAG: MgtC/SapB family protein [Turicibacter sp.]|nr:MgtC/SapB family protein [Turicibacter sp.]